MAQAAFAIEPKMQSASNYFKSVHVCVLSVECSFTSRLDVLNVAHHAKESLMFHCPFSLRGQA